jgi:peptidoglycan/LPS O-acetylase OafA/YrhL
LTSALVIGWSLAIAVIYAELPVVHGARPWGIAFGVLVVLLDLHNNVQPIRVPRPILYIGDISYSLYVTHWIFEWVYAQYIPVWAMPALWRIGLVAPYLGAILLLGTLSYRILERGLSEKVRRYFLS